MGRSTVDILKAARERISDPERWTRGVAGRDATGKPCDIDEAVCWCAYASLELEGGFACEACGYLLRAAQEQGVSGPSIVNDRLGHEATLAMYDCAIELADGLLARGPDERAEYQAELKAERRARADDSREAARQEGF